MKGLMALAAHGHVGGLDSFVTPAAGEGGGRVVCSAAEAVSDPAATAAGAAAAAAAAVAAARVHIHAGGLVVGLLPGAKGEPERGLAAGPGAARAVAGGAEADVGATATREDDWCWVACMLSTTELLVYGNEVALQPVADYLRAATVSDQVVQDCCL